MEKISFIRGFNLTPQGRASEVKTLIMEALGITSKPAWKARLTGKVEPKYSETVKIEEAFSKVGIEPHNVCGDEI